MYLLHIEHLVWKGRTKAIQIDDKGVLEKAHLNLNESVKDVYKDPGGYFASRLFLAHIGAFELFLQELATAVILRHPKKVGSTQFKLTEILETGDPTALVRRAIEELLNKLMYKKPSEYREELSALLSLDSTLFDPEWTIFVEAKARRDLGIHADWKCNSTYLRKLAEAQIPSPLSAGESAIPVDENYFNDTADALHLLAHKLTEAVILKHWADDAVREHIAIIQGLPSDPG